MSKIKVEDILKKHGFSKSWIEETEDGIDFKKAIKELIELAIDKAAEEAETEDIIAPSCDDHTPYRGPCVSCGQYHNPDMIIGSRVKQQSILNVKEMFDYE